MAQKQSEVWPPPLPVSMHSVRAASHWIFAPLTSLIVGSAGLAAGAILGCTLDLGILFVGKDLMRRH